MILNITLLRQIYERSDCCSELTECSGSYGYVLVKLESTRAISLVPKQEGNGNHYIHMGKNYTKVVN